jgi:hypothetical protein
MRRKALVGVVLVVVIAVATSVLYLRYAGLPSIFESDREREVREDSAFRYGADAVALSFLWTPDLSTDMLSSRDLKQMLFKVNRVLHEPLQVYIWLYKNALWEAPVEDIYHAGEGVTRGCSEQVWEAVVPYNAQLRMHVNYGLPIIVVRDIYGNFSGITCITEAPDVFSKARSRYIVLSFSTISSTNGYRVLVHELLEAFGANFFSFEAITMGAETVESQKYSLFPVNDPSVTSLVHIPMGLDYPDGSSYLFAEHRLGLADFIVSLPDDYNAFD